MTSARPAPRDAPRNSSSWSSFQAGVGTTPAKPSVYDRVNFVDGDANPETPALDEGADAAQNHPLIINLFKHQFGIFGGVVYHAGDHLHFDVDCFRDFAGSSPTRSGFKLRQRRVYVRMMNVVGGTVMQRTKLGFRSLSRAVIVSLVALGVACKSDEPAHSPEVQNVETAAEPAAPAPEAQPAEAKAEIVKEPYGDLNGQAVERYTLSNKNGLKLSVITYGAIITEFQVPDRTGKLGDIVLGFDKLDGYVKGSPYFGATVGRVANRIEGAKFQLEGKKYKLAANAGEHHLHGGTKGWDKVVWTAEPLETAEGVALKLTYVSPDGEEGYPGTVTATTIYTLTGDNALKVEMSATTDKTTIVGMAHHTYWNLGGQASGTIQNEVLQLFASQYTPAGKKGTPDGRIAKVAGTPFDFTEPKPIGKDLTLAGGTPIGFDHNWVVDGDPHQMRPMAKLSDPASGRTMTIEADQPGIQFYTGNYLDGTTVGKGGTTYPQYAGLCLESQKFPNSINVREWQKEIILSPGQTYKHNMIHRFTAE
jgi:aldose 1-epimerase